MLKLLRLAALLGLVAAFVFLLPFSGRTLFDRWRASRGAGDFAARTWAEMRGVGPSPSPGTPSVPRPGPAGKPPGAAAPQPTPDQPLESTTEAERRSLDKLLDQHLTEKPKR